MQNVGQVDVNLNTGFAFNDSEDELFIYLRFIIKKTEKKKPVPTLVLAAVLAPCGLDQPGISQPPRRSQGGTRLPPSPGEDRERQSTKGRSWAGLTVFSLRTVSSPDLMKGHQPLVLFC